MPSLRLLKEEPADRLVFAQDGGFVMLDRQGQIIRRDYPVGVEASLGSSAIVSKTSFMVAALSPDGSRLAVTSYNGNAVFLINTATDQMIKQIPVGREPLDITYSPDGRYLFTVNNLDNTVTVIDTADYSVIGEIPTGKAPTSISVLPNGRQAYVTDENSGTIEILNIP